MQPEKQTRTGMTGDSDTDDGGETPLEQQTQTGMTEDSDEDDGGETAQLSRKGWEVRKPLRYR